MNAKKICSLFLNPRVAIASGIIGTIFIIIDFAWDKVDFIIPAGQAMWMTLKLNVPVFALIFLAMLVFGVMKIKNRALNYREIFIISVLDRYVRGVRLLFRAYKKKFDRTSRTMSSCIATIGRLERKKIVEWDGNTGGIQDVQDETYKLTKKGLKRLEKLDPVIKERTQKILDEIANDVRDRKAGHIQIERIEPHDELISILEHLANIKDGDISKTILRILNLRKYPNKRVADFNLVFSRLEGNGFLSEGRGSTGYGSTGYYFIENKGLEYYCKFKDEK